MPGRMNEAVCAGLILSKASLETVASNDTRPRAPDPATTSLRDWGLLWLWRVPPRISSALQVRRSRPARSVVCSGSDSSHRQCGLHWPRGQAEPPGPVPVGLREVGLGCRQGIFEPGASLPRDLDFIAQAFDDFIDLRCDLLLEGIALGGQDRDFSTFQRSIGSQFIELAFDTCLFIAKGLDSGEARTSVSAGASLLVFSDSAVRSRASASDTAPVAATISVLRAATLCAWKLIWPGSPASRDFA